MKQKKEMDINKIIEWFEDNYLDGDKVQEGQMLSSSECLDALKQYKHKLLQSIVEMIPKEKPMNTFSFVLKGEELELYMQHKGFNQCRAEFKAKLTTNIKE